MRVAVDAMGGDHAPAEVVKGAVEALRRDPELTVLLVGIEPKVRGVLAELDADESRIEILHASETIAMGESPVEALRRKPDTSIQRCVEALRRHEVDAVLSAGDTGGVVAATTMFAKRLKGVKRHGIAIPIPTPKGRSLLIDVGANIHCKPIHLLQYAIMGSAYAQAIMGIEEPRVALLSVGEEEAKGNELVKKTRSLFARAELNFVGNVEGQTIFRGLADVIVCDGFVGNVILKVAEGLNASFLRPILGQVAAAEGLPDDTRAMLAGIKQKMDYSSTGGAPLIGVDGSVIICHGRSESPAIANAIGIAANFVKSGLNDLIVEGVARVGMLSRVADFFSREG